MLPAMSLDGILALEVLDHSFSTDDFNKFITRLLDPMNPFPMRNSVIVMDNASIHHSDELRHMVEAR